MQALGPPGSRAFCLRPGPPPCLLLPPGRLRFLTWGSGATAMIVVMKPGASPQEVQHVVAGIEELGLRSQIIVGTELTVVAALGEKRDGTRETLETLPGVDKVVPILAPYKIASREVKKEPTRIQVRNFVAGAGR